MHEAVNNLWEQDCKEIAIELLKLPESEKMYIKELVEWTSAILNTNVGEENDGHNK